MAVEDNLNLTTSPGLAPEMVTYYDMTLLARAVKKLVHANYGQVRGLPKGEGKSVNFRKFEALEKSTAPLEEGVTPTGKSLTVTEVLATIKPYGDYVAGSDQLSMTAKDKVLVETAQLLGDQAGEVIDEIIRTELLNTTNLIYADSVTRRSRLTESNVLDTVEVRKATRFLKNQNARRFYRGNREWFTAIINPDTEYDLQDDEKWEAVAEYQESEKIETGEIGRMYGCIFVVAGNIENVSAADLVLTGVNATRELTAAAASSYNEGTKVVTIQEALSADDAAALVGREVVLDIEGGNHHDIVAAAAEGAAGSATITLTTGYGGTATDVDGVTIYPGEAGATGNDIGQTLVLGADAYGLTDLGKQSKGKPTFIFMPIGSAGTADPLKQRWTSGWKVDGFVAKILQPLWLACIEHGISD